MRRAETDARRGHARRVVVAHGQRDPEIRDEGLPVLQEDVGGLDVAMDDAVPVRVVDCRRDLADEADRIGNGDVPLAVQSVSERAPGDEGHHVVRRAVDLAGVDKAEDVRVLETRDRLNLAQEPVDADVRRDVGVDHLDRDLALVLQVVRQMDGRHAAAPELALQAVAIRQGRAVDGASRAHGGVGAQ